MAGGTARLAFLGLPLSLGSLNLPTRVKGIYTSVVGTSRMCLLVGSGQESCFSNPFDLCAVELGHM